MKKYTKQDMVDAFWWGFNFREKTIMRKITNMFSVGDRAIKGVQLSDVAIENMFKEKR